MSSNVSVAEGSTSNNFFVETSSVGANTNVTITASYGGVSRSATLTVQPPALEAKFTVTSASVGSDGCSITGGVPNNDCRFDASGSSGSIDQYLWSFKVAGHEITKNTRDAATTVDTDCTFFNGATETDGKIDMTVALVLRGTNGQTSSTTSKTIKVTTDDRCDYDD